MTNELKRPEVIRKNDTELESKGVGKYTGSEYWYQGKPFTGFVVFEYYQNGNIAFEAEHVDGQTMGWDVEYYENGKIKTESLEGGATSVVYRDFDEEGNLLEEGWVASKTFYNKVAKETGMEPLNE